MKTLWILTLVGGLVIAGCGGGGRQDAATEKPAEQTAAETQTTPEPAAQPAAQPQTPPAKPAETKVPETPPSKPAEPAEPAQVTKMMTLPSGYAFEVSLSEQISTESHQAGRAFTAELTKPATLKTAGTVIPAGSKIRGEVTYSKPAARVGGKAQMTLEFRELTTPDGKPYPLYAEPLTLEGEGTASGDVQKVVGGAVGGAIVGGLLGGKEGAVKGGAAGAAGGAVWAVATRGNDIVIEPGQAILVTLQREIRVPVTMPAGANLP